MHAWEQIQETIEYIEKHLAEDIAIERLAKIAALSPYYYQRLFRRLVKKPVAEYIKLRRLAKSAEILLESDARILDIAFGLGFTSQEHFSRVFKDAFGQSPGAYRQNPQQVNRMTKPELLLQYTLIDEGVPLITNGIVLEVNRRVLTEPVSCIGLKRSASVQQVEGLGTESGIDPLATVWQEFHAKKESELGIAQESEEIGVAYPGTEEGQFFYFAGGKTEKDKRVSGYDLWELPAGTYIVCSFEAENFDFLVMDALYKAQQYMYGVWLQSHNLQTEAFCAERYPSHSPETTNMEIWMQVKE